MKTQMVKNAIIVPVGSKGGFVLKGTVPPRPALDSYLVDRYRQFISGLLDVTDNLVDGEVVHPPEVVRYDERRSVPRGGRRQGHRAPVGHRQLGLGAVRLLARRRVRVGRQQRLRPQEGRDHGPRRLGVRAAPLPQLGHDVQTQPFTMVGIGDMSGDVFGNGALRSRVTKLVAAFNHRHIFLDPDPDPERTFVERERLFALPRSTLARLRHVAHQRRRRRLRPVRQVDSAQRRGARAPGSRTGGGQRRGGDPAILRRRRSICSTTAASAPTSRRRAEDDADVGDRANDRVRVDATRRARAGDRRRRQPRGHAAGPHRVLAAAAD